jgi:hypothetical protein
MTDNFVGKNLKSERQLNKKTARKKKSISSIDKDFDIKKFKDRIFNEINNDRNPM